MSELERLKDRLLMDYEDSKTPDPDIAEYVRDHPEYREDLLDFWVLLRATPRLEELHRGDLGELDELLEQSVRDLCLSIPLGAGWLQSASEDQLSMTSVGEDCAALRGTVWKGGGKASQSFRKAAVYGWLARVLDTEKRRTTNLTLQKMSYFVERLIEPGVFRQHTRHRFGPFDPDAAFKTALPICIRKDYLIRMGNWEFAPGEGVAEAVKFAERYLRDPGLAVSVVRVLSRFDDWSLETLATVDAIAQDLEKGGVAVTADTVAEGIRTEPQWRKELERRNFQKAKIMDALVALSRLRLIDLR